MKLAVVLVCLCVVCSVARCTVWGPRVLCYVDPSTEGVLDPALCTHVVRSSAHTDDGCGMTSSPANRVAELNGLSRLKDRNPALKTLLSLSCNQSRWESMVSNQTRLDGFVSTVVRGLREQRSDGLDLTWTSNPLSEPSSPNATLLTHLLKMLRGAVEEEARLSGNESLLLSASVSVPVEHNRAAYDMSTFPQYVDFISLLLPDIGPDEQYINATVQSWHSRGVDSQKLSLAAPLFVRCRGRSRHRPRGKTTQESAGCELCPRMILANQMCKAIGSKKENLSQSIFNGRHPRDEAASQKEKGLGGVSVVYIDVDEFTHSVCDLGNQSLWTLLQSQVPTETHHHHHHHGHPQLYSHHCRSHHHHHRHHHRHGDRYPHRNHDGTHQLSHNPHGDHSDRSDGSHGHQYHDNHHHGRRHRGHRGHRHHGHHDHRHHDHGHRRYGHGGQHRHHQAPITQSS